VLISRSSFFFEGLGSLYAYIYDCDQIGRRLGLLHGDFLLSLEIVDPVVEGVDDLDVLDVWDGIPSIAETFHIVRRFLSGFCLMVFRVSAVDRCSYKP
jgi:hypothetical protein